MTANTIDINYGMTAMSESELAATEGGGIFEWILRAIEAVRDAKDIYDYVAEWSNTPAGQEYWALVGRAMEGAYSDPRSVLMNCM